MPRTEPMRHRVQLPTSFRGTEFHRKARLVGHVDGVVEHHTRHGRSVRPRAGKRLVVKRGVEQGGREIGPEGPANLNRCAPAIRTACRRRWPLTSSPSVMPNTAFEQSAKLGAPSQLNRRRGARTPHANLASSRGGRAP